MAVLSGKDGALKVGATSETAVGHVTSWTLNRSVDEYPGKYLGVAYTTRNTGHTDWTATLEVDLDESDAQLDDLVVEGVAAILFLYTDADSNAGRTGTGVVLSVAETVAGTANNKVTVNVGGNGALAEIGG